MSEIIQSSQSIFMQVYITLKGWNNKARGNAPGQVKSHFKKPWKGAIIIPHIPPLDKVCPEFSEEED